MTRVSVVIPVKDDDTELRRCLRALALQTRVPDEVIVVDNCSTDASAAVGREAGAIVLRGIEPGIPPTARRGYDAATGDIILRLDADCLPGVSWVDEMASAFERHPAVAAFSGGARFIDGPRRLRAPLAAIYLVSYAAVSFSALGHLPLFGSNLGFRRDVWRRVRRDVHLSPEVHDDLDLAFHIGVHGLIRYAPRAAMGVSMRPFGDARSFLRRAVRGVRTVVIHWPRDFPPVRWMHIGMRRAVDRREAAAHA